MINMFALVERIADFKTFCSTIKYTFHAYLKLYWGIFVINTNLKPVAQKKN